MTATLFLGTSGFAYQEWRGVFYPESLSSSRMLPFYANRFNSVEINYTYRKIPAEGTIQRWAEQVPEGFRFTLKANQRITHFKRLRDVTTDVAEFVRLARLLGNRLGLILVQLPPTLEHDPALLEAFLGLLPTDVRFAMEFRHPSWVAAGEALVARGVMWCVAETDERPADPGALPPGPFVYLRLRKEAYDDAELAAWARAIAGALDDERDVYCYFKHEDKAAGPRFAERLREVLEEVSPGSGTR
jgi:uncharacterized protein YecE (DUF72 family)